MKRAAAPGGPEEQRPLCPAGDDDFEHVNAGPAEPPAAVTTDPPALAPHQRQRSYDAALDAWTPAPAEPQHSVAQQSSPLEDLEQPMQAAATGGGAAPHQYVLSSREYQQLLIEYMGQCTRLEAALRSSSQELQELRQQLRELQAAERASARQVQELEQQLRVQRDQVQQGQRELRVQRGLVQQGQRELQRERGAATRKLEKAFQDTEQAEGRVQQLERQLQEIQKEERAMNKRYTAAETRSEELEAELQQLRDAAAAQLQQQPSAAHQAQLQQAQTEVADARRAAAAAEQRAAAAEEQLAQLAEQMQRKGGIGGFFSNMLHMGGGGGSARKQSAREGPAAAAQRRQHLHTVEQQLPGALLAQAETSPSFAAGGEAAAAGIAAAQLQRIVRPRLLHCYDATPIDFGPSVQQQALESLAKGVEVFVEQALVRLCGPESPQRLVQLLDRALLRLLCPGAPPAAQFCRDSAKELLRHLYSQHLLVPAIAHVVLHWMAARLWEQPLALAGLGGTGQEVLAAAQSSDEEKEAALQLRALSCQRVYRQLAGAAFQGQQQGQQQQGQLGIRLPAAPAVWMDQLELGLSIAALDLCHQLGLGRADEGAVQLVRQGYRMGLLMGAAHRELRPLLATAGSALDTSRQNVMKEAAPLQLGGSGDSGAAAGGAGAGGQPAVVLVSRRPGWEYRGRQQLAIAEEVVVLGSEV